jgi:hypothetical protein
MEVATSARLVTARGFVRAAALFGLVAIAGHLLARFACTLHPFDCPRWWPVSVFERRMPAPADVLFAVLAVVVFEVARRRIGRDESALVPSLAAVLVVLCSTATQGIPRGFEHPIAGLMSNGKAIQYFHDAARFTGVADVLSRWNELQPSLETHASTHPPGAVVLAVLLPQPTWLGIVWLLVSTLVASFALHGLATHLFGDRRVASTAVLLFAVLPAVQIYFGATLDALLAAVLLAALAVHVSRSSLASAVGTGLLLAIAAFLSFGAWIAVPMLPAVEFAEHKAVKRSAIAILVAMAALAALRAFGFDYIASFRTAAQIENPGGFRLLVDPVGYVGTRLEDVAEILFFLGPAFLYATFRSRGSLAPPSRALVLAGLGSLVAAYLAGAFRTGETARCCIFAAPLFLLPILSRLHARPDDASRDLVLRATLGYGLVMQLFGDWFW